MRKTKKRIVSAVTSFALFLSSSACCTTVSASENELSANIPILESILSGDRHFVIDTLINEDMSQNPHAKVYGIENSRSMMRTVLNQYSNKDDPNYSWLYTFCVNCIIAWENKADVTNDIANAVTDMTAEQLEQFGDSSKASAVLTDCIQSSRSMHYDNILQSVISADYTSASGTTLSGADAQLTSLRAFADGSKRIKDFAAYLKGLSDLDSKEENSVSEYVTNVFIPAANAGEKLMNDLESVSGKHSSGTYGKDDAFKTLMKEFTKSMAVAAMYSTREITGDDNGDKVSQLAPEHLLGQGTLALIKNTDKFASLYSSTIDSYMYINAIQTQSDAVSGVMKRTAEFMPTSDEKNLLTHYAYLIDNAGNENIKNFDAIVKTLKSQGAVTKVTDKAISKGMTALKNRLIPVYEESIIPSSLSKLTGIVDTTLSVGDAVTGAKQTAVKTYELSNTDKLLQYFISAYQSDLKKYKSKKSDENAANVLDDLSFIQRIRLRGETLAYNMTKGQLETPLGLLLSGGYDWTEYYDTAYSQIKDALIGASVMPVTADTLTLPSNSSTTLCYEDGIGYYADITKSDGSKFKTAEIDRIIPNGLTIGQNSKVIVMPNIKIELPHVTNSGGNLSFVDDTSEISEYTQRGGELCFSNSSGNVIDCLDVSGGTLSGNDGASLTAESMLSSGTVQINMPLTINSIFQNSGNLTVADDKSITTKGLSVNSGTISGNTLNAVSDFSNTGNISVNTLNVNNDYLSSGNTAVNTLNLKPTIVSKISGNISASYLISSDRGTISADNPIIVTGTLTNQGKSFSGNTVTLKGSFGSETYYGNINLDTPIIDKHVSIYGDVNNTGSLTLNNDMYINGTFTNTGSLTLNNDMYIDGSFTNSSDSTINASLIVGKHFTNNKSITIGTGGSVISKNITSNSSSISGDGTFKSCSDMLNNGNVTVNSLELNGDYSGSGNTEVHSLNLNANSKSKISGNISTAFLYSGDSGIIDLDNPIIVTGTLTNQGASFSGNAVTLKGGFGSDTYYGNINLDTPTIDKHVSIYGDVNNVGGLTLNNEISIIGNFTNSSNANINAPISVSESLTNNASLNVNIPLTLDMPIKNNGTINVENGYLTLNKHLENNKNITIGKNHYVNTFAMVTNNSSISGDGTFKSCSDMQNKGSVTVNSLELNGDYHNEGTTNIDSLAIHETGFNTINGNSIDSRLLTVSGGGKINLNTQINVSEKYTNDKTDINDENIVLPAVPDAPVKNFVSDSGLSLDGTEKNVTADCTISGGNISLKNGAKLIVGGIFRASNTTVTIDESSELIISRYSILNNISDITNDGKISFGSDIQLNSSKLSGSGEYILYGDLIMSGSEIQKPRLFTISGGTAQMLSGSGMLFDNINIQNKSAAGIEFTSDAKYSGSLTNNDTPVKGNLTKTEE